MRAVKSSRLRREDLGERWSLSLVKERTGEVVKKFTSVPESQWGCCSVVLSDRSLVCSFLFRLSERET